MSHSFFGQSDRETKIKSENQSICTVLPDAVLRLLSVVVWAAVNVINKQQITNKFPVAYRNIFDEL